MIYQTIRYTGSIPLHNPTPVVPPYSKPHDNKYTALEHIKNHASHLISGTDQNSKSEYFGQ